jgi:hypothetical protein
MHTPTVDKEEEEEQVRLVGIVMVRSTVLRALQEFPGFQTQDPVSLAQKLWRIADATNTDDTDVDDPPSTQAELLQFLVSRDFRPDVAERFCNNISTELLDARPFCQWADLLCSTHCH